MPDPKLTDEVSSREVEARGNHQLNITLFKQIVAYGEAMVRCYQTQLSQEERQALHKWESSEDFTRTDDWPGWAPHIGLRPGVQIRRPKLVPRCA